MVEFLKNSLLKFSLKIFVSLNFRNEYKNLIKNKNKNGINDERLLVMCIAGIKKLKFCINQDRQIILNSR